MSEKLDVWSEDGAFIKVEDRETVHLEGLWHQTFHCWIVRNELDQRMVLFQLRHPEKDISANKLDISAAGHLEAGETPEDGVRELEEELGIHLDFHDLISVGLIKETIVEKPYVDRERCHVFIGQCNQSTLEYAVQETEVSGLFEIPAKDMLELLEGKRKTVTGEGFTILHSTKRQETKDFMIEDFVAHQKSYYQEVFQRILAL
ncbi:NUDIX domain-containing protein (plasmid) [Radiobacillus kanasensis]|uniref:NUDIX hydrolase n=1 Tax=Radiobacillus kanasensis TaxID=2844358 RepID=UPI001E543D45|nr:NUDIX domain-containing protein [Radiobacillus kanasensis]UFU01482.1 NUDIX domain-containing protein [Radiobacillus kanasensis]